MSKTHKLTDKAVCEILKCYTKFWKEDDMDVYKLSDELYEILMWFGDELYNLD